MIELAFLLRYSTIAANFFAGEKTFNKFNAKALHNTSPCRVAFFSSTAAESLKQFFYVIYASTNNVKTRSDYLREQREKEEKLTMLCGTRRYSMRRANWSRKGEEKFGELRY